MKLKLGGASDYRLGKELGVAKQTISELMHGKSAMSPTTAARVAELLELEPIQVIADAELERATRPEQRRLWERIAAKVAAGVLVAIGASIAAPTPAGANEAAAVYYVKRRRRWILPLLPPLDPPDGLA